jgi:hypothetical protein
MRWRSSVKLARPCIWRMSALGLGVDAFGAAVVEGQGLRAEDLVPGDAVCGERVELRLQFLGEGRAAGVVDPPTRRPFWTMRPPRSASRRDRPAWSVHKSFKAPEKVLCVLRGSLDGPALSAHRRRSPGPSRAVTSAIASGEGWK